MLHTVDSVTGLPNRQQFFLDYDQLNKSGHHIVLVTVTEAQHFNALLRALGHDYADDYVRAGADRIRSCVPENLTVYHVSVLSFAFFGPRSVLSLVNRVLSCSSEPLLSGGIPITTRFGIGVAETANTSAPDVLRSALAAAQDSRFREEGWAHYDRNLDNAHRRGFMILSDLPDALASDAQMYLAYQPKYDLATGQPVGAEALLRWNHPTLGPISPAEFVPLTEGTYLINNLTDWVFQRAIGQAAAWQASGLKLNLAINVAPNNLANKGFAQNVLSLLRDRNVAASSIETEFTEGALSFGNANVLAELNTLREGGVHVALDDFGTGFSNFSYIAHLPADIIKIDRSFIQLIGDDERSAIVVRSLIELAHRLKYRVVAEGVETEKAYRMLGAWGCDEGQGYFMSKPLRIGEFDQKILSAESPNISAAMLDG